MITIKRAPIQASDSQEVLTMARTLYSQGAMVSPSWDQLGETTKRVWMRCAMLKLSGVPDWWSTRHEQA